MNKSNFLQNEVTTMATCWKLKLKNNTELGFTDFVRDIVINNLTYKAQSGFFSSSIESTATVSVDNLEIGGFLNEESISKEDILSALYDHAFLEIFVINYQDASEERIVLKSGYLGEVRLKNNQFVAEVRGLSEKLSNSIGSLYSPTCRAEFCGTECKLKKTYEIECNIVSIENKTQIKIDREINNILYDCGVVKIGEHFIPIKKCNDDNITLMFQVPAILLPVTCTLYSGCDKSFNTCYGVYDNAVNFRGEPHVPGIDEIHKTAGTFR